MTQFNMFWSLSLLAVFFPFGQSVHEIGIDCVADDYIYSDDGNFVLVNCTAEGWSESIAYCEDTFGTTLATDLSASDSASIELLCKSSYQTFYWGLFCWIGFEVGQEYTDDFYWLDGSDTSGYSNWRDGSPTTFSDPYTCGSYGAYLYSSSSTYDVWGWAHVNCGFGGHTLICNYEPAPTPAPTFDESLFAMTTYKGYIGIASFDGMSWDDADNFCFDEFGTHLASIHDSDENYNVYKAYYNVINGAISNGWSYEVSYQWGHSTWIGFNDEAQENTWIWSDGTDNSYTNWFSSTTTNNGNNYDCAVLDALNGQKWFDLGCTNDRHYFVCNIYPTQAPTPKPTDNPTPQPTPAPTPNPTPNPTLQPTTSPTPAPTNEPTDDPTPAPTDGPTPAPTNEPTPAPTDDPTPAPTDEPTPAPTDGPTPAPTNEPTPAPTAEPTPAPTDDPTPAPTDEPTPAPTNEPTDDPTPAPTDEPTQLPTVSPTWVQPCVNDPCNCDKHDSDNFEDPNCRVCHYNNGLGNGCSQCKRGPRGENGFYFKLDYNYPCVECKQVFGDGCNFCQDFNGCGQCNSNYNRVKDETEDVWYCQPKDEQIEEPPTEPTEPITNCPIAYQPCFDNKVCSANENPQCNDQRHWGCQGGCTDGYWFESYKYPCVSCDIIPNCLECNNWNGCKTCNDGFTKQYQSDCGQNGFFICV